MRIPVMKGIIDRRILVNYHVGPDAILRVLPAPFRPKLVKGLAIAGICLIRLKQIRPWFIPGRIGFSSENAAHRIAVEWDDNGVRQEGVYVPRRDTSSQLNTLVGGRMFPGVHHHARFHVCETLDHLSVVLDSDDDGTHVAVEGHVTGEWPSSSVFDSLQEASEFFRSGSLGYSPTRQAGLFDGLELRTAQWEVQPLAIEQVESSFFSNVAVFPPGSVQFDCALLMRGLAHEWHGRPSLCGEKCREAVPLGLAVDPSPAG